MGFLSVSSLVVIVTGYFLYLLTVVDLEWTRITVEMIASSQHSSIVSEQLLLISRVFFAVIIWASIVYIVSDPVGLELTIQNFDGSKKAHLFKGFERLTMFTVWSWILQGFYFTFAAISSFAAINQVDFPQLHLFSQQYLALPTWILFEISFPVAYLVSAVVTFVLIPFVKKEGLPAKTFFLPMALLMHNANIVFMAWEFMLNELSFSYYHFIFMLFYGISYVIFSWIWYVYRGVFYYFFLDYKRKYALIWYIVLLIFITILFFIGYYLSILQFQGHSFIANAIVAVLTVGSMKLIDS